MKSCINKNISLVSAQKNGDNSFAAVDISAIAIWYKSVITIFYFAAFDVSLYLRLRIYIDNNSLTITLLGVTGPII